MMILITLNYDPDQRESGCLLVNAPLRSASADKLGRQFALPSTINNVSIIITIIVINIFTIFTIITIIFTIIIFLININIINIIMLCWRPLVQKGLGRERKADTGMRLKGSQNRFLADVAFDHWRFRLKALVIKVEINKIHKIENSKGLFLLGMAKGTLFFHFLSLGQLIILKVDCTALASAHLFN